jgi:UDP-glucose 4-epimerase
MHAAPPVSSSTMKVLITGGAGYIGSTVASACLDRGVTPVILDDLSTGRREFVEGRQFYAGDIADPAIIDRIFAEHPDIAATIHCAARIVVPESVRDPIGYYRSNVTKTVELVEHLLRNGCHRLIFSSSAAMYAPTGQGWVDEGSPLAPSSPYARTKVIVETALEDFTGAYDLRVLSLRYFNPIGADPLLRTGLQNPSPSHVLGRLIAAHATGEPFQLTGVGWDTRDGTAIRDYVHVWDLAEAHVAGLLRFDDVVRDRCYEVVNVGTGRGTTVRELVAAFQEVVGQELTVVETEPRPGDVLGCYTAGEKAATTLGWRARYPLVDAIRHSLEWDAVRDKVLGSR